jgi:hypothetical protein
MMKKCNIFKIIMNYQDSLVRHCFFAIRFPFTLQDIVKGLDLRKFLHNLTNNVTDYLAHSFTARTCGTIKKLLVSGVIT